MKEHSKLYTCKHGAVCDPSVHLCGTMCDLTVHVWEWCSSWTDSAFLSMVLCVIWLYMCKHGAVSDLTVHV